MMVQHERFRVTRRSLLFGIAASAAASSLPAITSAQPASSIAWEQVAHDGSGPSPRWDHALVADAARRRLILFGGRDAAGTALGDTWAFDIDAGAWSEIPGERPSPRFGVAVAADASGEGIFLFGGQSADVFFNDTWRFEPASDTWEQIDTGEGTAPSPRYGLGSVIDDAGRFIVSHGFTFEGRFDDTWALDTIDGGWSDISPPQDTRPLKRCLHEQVWDAGSGLMLLYGGCSSGFGPCPQGDTWTFDPVSGSWREVTPVSGPDARSNPALTATGAATLLVGGLTEVGYAGDAWLGVLEDGTFTWTALDPYEQAPSPRASHDMTVVGDRVYLFGGTGDDGALGDLWSATLVVMEPG